MTVANSVVAIVCSHGDEHQPQVEQTVTTEAQSAKGQMERKADRLDVETATGAIDLTTSAETMQGMM